MPKEKDWEPQSCGEKKRGAAAKLGLRKLLLLSMVKILHWFSSKSQLGLKIF